MGIKAINRETGYYWIKVYEDWFLTKFHREDNSFYFPGYNEGVEPKKIKKIEEKRLEKKFEGYKKRKALAEEQVKVDRQEGYYWVMHDAMWFAAYYITSMNEFYFPGQIIGFDPHELEEIDEQRIERNISS